MDTILLPDAAEAPPTTPAEASSPAASAAPSMDINPDPLTSPLLTAGGGILDRGPDAREVIAIYENGHIWYCLGAANHPLVHATLALARLRGKPARLHDPRPVTPAALKAAYAAATRASAAPVDLAATQIRVADYVRQSYEAGANDLIILASRSEGAARMKILGSILDLPWSITREQAEAMHLATHNLSNAVGAGFNPTANQSVSVLTADHEDLPWPDGLDSLRVTYIHTAYGMEMQIRFPRHEVADHTFPQLGLHPDQVRLIDILVRLPTGGIWAIGDVGTGKSRLLKRILRAIHEHAGGGLDIKTMEDPVEEFIEYAMTQVQIVAGRTLEETMREYEIQYRDLLRAGPNVLLGGEVRDPGSAMLAVETVRTGIRLLTTAHGGTVWDAHARLKRYGMDEDALYSAKMFSGMIGQRLLGRLCTCAVPLLDSREARADGLIDRARTLLAAPGLRGFWPWPDDALARMRVARPNGCNKCRIVVPSLASSLRIPRWVHGTIGRVAAAEIALPDTDLMSVFKAHGASAVRDAWIESGGHTMVAHACHHMAEGTVSPAEVERVLRPLDQIAALHGLEPLAC